MTILNHTTSLCARCKRSLPATVVQVDQQVILKKSCPEHGDQEALVSSDAAWYAEVMGLAARPTPPVARNPVSQGCPYDCGPCTRHEQRLHLPIVPITSACNLDCPICYTHNKNEGAWHMSDEEMRSLLDHLRAAAPERRIINLTGGEPTQHPDLARIVALCVAEGIHRITISTHGLRFLRDEELVRNLAAAKARIILSFDSLTDAGNVTMLGGTFLTGKLRVLDVLERHGLDTTLLPVLAKGVNDHEVGNFVALALSRDHVRSVELHPMTFTGQGGVGFDRRGRYGTIEVLKDLERQTEGRIAVRDFVPSPIAHPLCYLATYLLRLDDGRWIPFPRFMRREDLRLLLAGGLYLETGPDTEQLLQDVIARLWARDVACDDPDGVLAALRRLVDEVFAPGVEPLERMRVAERRTKAIYVHSHMDEESFDTDRIRLCPVGIREPDGTNVPSCAYNILYRERDARFRAVPKPAIAHLGPGRID
jgi:uncharacterized radical SAM superfamily Fe-S cluster-containing enzyme